MGAEENSKEVCPICRAGQIGRGWARDLVLGRKTAGEAAIYFRISETAVMEHVNTHEIDFGNDEEEPQTTDYYMGRLFKIVKKIDEWITYISESGSYDTRNGELLVKLLREMRQTIESLAAFQGRLDKSNNVNVKIESVEMKFLALTQVLLQEVCEECRGKIIEIIDAPEIKQLK